MVKSSIECCLCTLSHAAGLGVRPRFVAQLEKVSLLPLLAALELGQAAGPVKTAKASAARELDVKPGSKTPTPPTSRPVAVRDIEAVPGCSTLPTSVSFFALVSPKQPHWFCFFSLKLHQALNPVCHAV